MYIQLFDIVEDKIVIVFIFMSRQEMELKFAGLYSVNIAASSLLFIHICNKTDNLVIDV